MPQKIGQARKAKLSIPKIQQPRNGGTTAPRGPAMGIGQNHGGMRGGLAPNLNKSLATSTAQPSNAVPQTQSQPTDPFQAVSPQQGPVGFGKFTVAGAGGYAPGEDPRDASYWDAVSKLAFTDSQEYSRMEREQTRADTDYNDAVATALRNRLGQQRELGESAIRGNLGASGWLNRTEADQTTAYTQQRAHAQRVKELEDQDRAAGMSGLIGQFGIDAGTILHEALGRFAEGKANEASEAEPDAPPVAAAAGPIVASKPTGYIVNHPIQAKAFAQLMNKNRKKKGRK